MDEPNEKGWTTVTFGDVVRKVSDRVDPESSGLERYVAGEHMSTDDLRIRQWGTIGDGYLGPAFHMRFKPGHVLYGSRRTYLRKVAVPDFEGVTSNTTFVLEPKTPAVLLPEFLPFVMQAESFHSYSIGQSKGSVNPYVNFSDLADYEFALPPLGEQRRIHQALSHSVALQEALSQLVRAHKALTSSFMLTTFSSLSLMYPLKSVDHFGAATMGRQKAPRFRQGKSPRPYVRVANIGWLAIEMNDLEEMDFTSMELQKYRLIPGDILLTEGDLISELNVGRPAVFEGGAEDCCFQNTLIRMRPTADVPPLFLLLLMEGARLGRVFAKAAKTTTVTHLGLGRFGELVLPFPPSDVQVALAEKVSGLLEAGRNLEQRRNALFDVHRKLLAGTLS